MFILYNELRCAGIFAAPSLILDQATICEQVGTGNRQIMSLSDATWLMRLEEGMCRPSSDIASSDDPAPRAAKP